VRKSLFFSWDAFLGLTELIVRGIGFEAHRLKGILGQVKGFKKKVEALFVFNLGVSFYHGNQA